MTKLKKGLPSRIVALDILNLIMFEAINLDDAVDKSKKYLSLSKEDRAFVKLLVMAVLRNRATIDAILSKFIKLPLDKLKPKKLLNILRLGVVQILFIDNSSQYAAVDMSVELAGYNKKTRAAKSMINAVLRNIIRSDINLDKIKQNNIPNWLFQTWINDYGLEDAEKIAKYSLKQPYLDITVKDSNMLKEIADKIGGKILRGNSIRCTNHKGNITNLFGFQEGYWWVQDIAASLPVKILADSYDLRGKTVIDLCAAPGGKTMQLASYGAKVIAFDKSAKRLKKLEDNLKRTNLLNSVEIIEADVRNWRPDFKADFILLDAPCSATGTIRRHPDLLYIRNKNDIDNLLKIQFDIIKNASNILSNDGAMIYCTCSLQKQEGEGHFIESKLNKLNLQIAPIKEVKGLDISIGKSGFVRVFPYVFGGMDGFFIARLRRSC